MDGRACKIVWCDNPKSFPAYPEEEVPRERLLEVSRTCDGFIDRDGKYHVLRRPDRQDLWGWTPHLSYARDVAEMAFPKEVEDGYPVSSLIKPYMDAQDWLVIGKGWISVSSCAGVKGIQTPGMWHNPRDYRPGCGQGLTKAQEETLRVVFEARGYSEEDLLRMLLANDPSGDANTAMLATQSEAPAACKGSPKKLQ